LYAVEGELLAFKPSYLPVAQKDGLVRQDPATNACP